MPKSGFTPVRIDIATPSFAKQYPRTAVILDALRTGYAEKTLAYNTAVNQVSGPWFSMFTSAVFGGDVAGAIRKGQTGFARALNQAQQ
jgi:multiple sugar transport system substrate-binding protein